MPLFARESTQHCPFILPFCESTIGPGPAIMNAATAKESIQYNDPSLRDPNAALDKYAHRIAPEMILGIVFVALLVCFALALWVILDKSVRARLRRVVACGRRKGAGVAHSPEAQPSMSRASTATAAGDLESAVTPMKLAPHRPRVSRMPSPLRQDSSRETKSGQSAQLPLAQLPSAPLLPSL
ncbi:hypothetical protein PsYK624_021420 [Phanerochaete sordida]|uniref:Uncharacterized protein n=1 Tax=Phanerochaete sordida TaxID=48140 RepID=A0A9P3FZE5_9APHY|nr:hypothetical protein PsYK624_021420 [Phanerochaete sordida]